MSLLFPPKKEEPATMLLTKELREKLIINGQNRQYRQRLGDQESDYKPVVKLFTPDAQCTWLLTELDPDTPYRVSGLCDLGMGTPELGYVSIEELKTIRGPMGLPVERDRWFEADRITAPLAQLSTVYPDRRPRAPRKSPLC